MAIEITVGCTILDDWKPGNILYNHKTGDKGLIRVLYSDRNALVDVINLGQGPSKDFKSDSNSLKSQIRHELWPRSDCALFRGSVTINND